MDEFDHLFATVNGISMHMVTAGSGPLVLLLHGFPEFWYSWRYQIPALAEHLRVVAPDQRGYNLTEKPQRGYDVDTLVADVADLVRLLGYERAYVVGHDWGGVVAWWLAIKRPELVDRLVIMNAPHPAAFQQALAGANQRQALRSWYILFFQLPWLPEFLMSLGDYWAIGEVFRRSTTRPDAFSDAVLCRYRRAAARPGALTAMLNWYRAALDLRVYRSAGRGNVTVRAPTLVIWGERDLALDKTLNQGLDRWVPDLAIRYLPDASHWVQQDRPERVNRYLLEFLA